MSETTDSDELKAQIDSDEPETGPEPSPEPAVAAEPPTPAGATVMLLGSGELSRELTLAFQRLGASVIAVDRYADAPAHGVADRSAVVKLNDAEALTAVIEKERPRYVVAEANLIAADALIAVAERGDIEVFPTPRSTRLSAGPRRAAAARRRRARPAHRSVLVRGLRRGADRGRPARRFPAGRQADRGGTRRG